MYQQAVIDGGVEVGASPFPEAIGVHHPLETYNASDFHPPPYTPSSNVDHQHHFPRFGHTNNFEELVDGITQSSSETSTDYIVGVCAGAMLIFSVALLWGMIIIGLKIAGQKRVGFLAGRLEHPACLVEAGDAGTLPAIPEEGTEDEEDEGGGALGSSLGSALTTPLVISNNIEEGARVEKKFRRKVRAVRIAFVVSGLAVIVSGALFYAKGITAFERSLDSMHGGIEMVQDTANKAINVTETVIADKNALVDDFAQTKRNTTEDLCEGDGQIAREVQGYAEKIAGNLEELNSMVDDTLDSFAGDLHHLITITEDVDDGLNNARILFYVALSISVLLFVLILSMLAVAFFSARGIANCCTKCLTNAILWPLFVCLLVLFWIFALLFLVSSLTGSDFCTDPDQVFQGVLYQYQDQFHSEIFEFIIYYISGCQVVPSDQSQISDIATQIKDVLQLVHQMSETLMGLSLPAIESECGLDSAGASALQGGAELLHEATHAINRAMIEIRTMLECKTFNPIYAKFVHEAICVEGVDGLTWIFSTSFFIFVFAMCMIMFQAALYPVKRPVAQSETVGLSASLLSKSSN